MILRFFNFCLEMLSLWLFHCRKPDEPFFVDQPPPRKLKFPRFHSNEQYLSQIDNCFEMATYFIRINEVSMAGWWAERGAQYANDLIAIQNESKELRKVREGSH